MLRLDRILGHETDGALAERLHELEHRGRVEIVTLEGDDILRHRLRVSTSQGTECAIMLSREQRLSNGAVLLVETDRAIVVRLKEARWLSLRARDQAAAQELGYFAGNMHWPVRFDGTVLRIELHGSIQSYLDRLAHLMNDGRVRIVDEPT
jgi:urease accessory protein